MWKPYRDRFDQLLKPNLPNLVRAKREFLLAPSSKSRIRGRALTKSMAKGAMKETPESPRSPPNYTTYAIYAKPCASEVIFSISRSIP